MKRFARLGLLLTGIVALGVFLAVVFASPDLKPRVLAPYDPPRLVVERQNYPDAGTTPLNTPVYYRLYNLGGKPLVIRKIWPPLVSPKAWRAFLSKTTIRPGEFAVLSMARVYSACDFGIDSNDPKTPHRRIPPSPMPDASIR